MFFRTTLKDAAPNTIVHRLAKKELEELEKP